MKKTGVRHTVAVRATDVAGRVVETQAGVTVDIARPEPGETGYAYVKRAGETVSMEPGRRIVDPVSLVVRWGAAKDAGGSVRYEVDSAARRLRCRPN